MEKQDRPRRDLRGLWLVPVLGLGLAVFVSSRKKPPRPPLPPTELMMAERAKHDAYHQAQYLLISQFSRGQPEGCVMVGYAPYSSGLVTRMGPTRFRCSSSLTVRCRTGELRKERWKCVITGSRNNWTLESFQHTPPESAQAKGAKPRATSAAE